MTASTAFDCERLEAVSDGRALQPLQPSPGCRHRPSTILAISTGVIGILDPHRHRGGRANWCGRAIGPLGDVVGRDRGTDYNAGVADKAGDIRERTISSQLRLLEDVAVLENLDAIRGAGIDLYSIADDFGAEPRLTWPTRSSGSREGKAGDHAANHQADKDAADVMELAGVSDMLLQGGGAFRSVRVTFSCR